MTTWTDHEIRATSMLLSANAYNAAIEATSPEDRMGDPDAPAEVLDDLRAAIAYGNAVLARDEGALELVRAVWPETVGGE